MVFASSEYVVNFSFENEEGLSYGKRKMYCLNFVYLV